MSLVSFNDKIREVVFSDYQVSGGWTLLPENKMGKVLATKGSELYANQAKVNDFLLAHGLPAISDSGNAMLIVDKDLWKEKIEPTIQFNRTFKKLNKQSQSPGELYSCLEKIPVPQMDHLTEKVSQAVLESQIFAKAKAILEHPSENSEPYRSILDDSLRYDIWLFR